MRCDTLIRKEKETSKNRIAVVNVDRCHPSKCAHQCKTKCPVVRMGKRCVEIGKKSKISEVLCIGCGACVRECPYNAIQIINLPKTLTSKTSHRYGPNSFKLHGLPIPKKGKVLGIVGINGIGKSTMLKILTGNIQPNLGKFEEPPEWEEIIHYFRGSELQTYFSMLKDQKITTSIKPQYVDAIPKRVKGSIGKVFERIAGVSGKDRLNTIITELELEALLDRKPAQLSGGELQRFTIGAALLKNADIYVFDEPCSYLDIHHRIKCAQLIRSLLLEEEKYGIVVEHDLSILDYISDYISIVHGKAGAYGIVSAPFGVGEGINHFLEGYIPTENIRFRDYPIRFTIACEDTPEEVSPTEDLLTYPDLKEVVGDGSFILEVESGSVSTSQITLLLGRNGLGKTTFVKTLIRNITQVVSYKPQKINPTFKGTVKQLLVKRIRKRFHAAWFISCVLKPLKIADLENLLVTNLSGGELQRVALALALGVPADIYFLDEPSSYLDVEMRNTVARIIKRFVMTYKKTAFVVEHDLVMGAYLADQIVLFTGQPGIKAVAHSPQTLYEGMNVFLKGMGVTLRQDPATKRSKINKLNSVKDLEQKKSGAYFLTEPM